MFGVYCIDNNEKELIAKVSTREEADKIVSHIEHWCDEVYELMGHSDFNENFGEVEYLVKEMAEEELPDTITVWGHICKVEGKTDKGDTQYVCHLLSEPDEFDATITIDKDKKVLGTIIGMKWLCDNMEIPLSDRIKAVVSEIENVYNNMGMPKGLDTLSDKAKAWLMKG